MMELHLLKIKHRTQAVIDLGQCFYSEQRAGL